MTDKLAPTETQLKTARVIHIKPRQQQVLAAFFFLFNKNGVFPSGYDVVAYTGLTEHQVNNAITALKRKGLIKSNRH